MNTIVSKNRFTSTAGTTNYNVGIPFTAAHLVNIDGLTLVEGIDYNLNADRMGFTLTQAVSAGRDIDIIRWSDVAALGDGEVNVSALATGTLPSGITVPGAQVNGAVTAARSADASSFIIGNWTIAQDISGRLTFANSGTIRARLDTDGHFRTEGDVTAFDNL